MDTVCCWLTGMDAEVGFACVACGAMVGRIYGGFWLGLESWGEIERARSKW